MLFPNQGLSGLKTFHSGLLFNSHVSTQVTPWRYCPSFISVAVIKYTDIKQLSEKEVYFRLQFRLQSIIIGKSGARNFKQLVMSCTQLRAERDECIHSGLLACAQFCFSTHAFQYFCLWNCELNLSPKIKTIPLP